MTGAVTELAQAPTKSYQILPHPRPILHSKMDEGCISYTGYNWSTSIHPVLSLVDADLLIIHLTHVYHVCQAKHSPGAFWLSTPAPVGAGSDFLGGGGKAS